MTNPFSAPTTAPAEMELADPRLTGWPGELLRGLGPTTPGGDVHVHLHLHQAPQPAPVPVTTEWDPDPEPAPDLMVPDPKPRYVTIRPIDDGFVPTRRGWWTRHWPRVAIVTTTVGAALSVLVALLYALRDAVTGLGHAAAVALPVIGLVAVVVLLLSLLGGGRGGSSGGFSGTWWTH